MIAVVTLGWRYAPQDVKEKLLGAVGIAARGNGAQVKHFIADVVLPQDPAQRRAVLAGELKKNIAELRRRIETDTKEEAALDAVGDSGSSATAAGGSAEKIKIRTASVRGLISASEGIVKEMENADQGASAGSRVMGRVLDVILPAPAPECPVK